MKHPDEITSFINKIQHDFPSAKIDLDEPRRPDGDWWIDLHINTVDLNLIWKKSLGFGIFTDEKNTYGEGPNEIHRSYIIASKRIGQLTKRSDRTKTHAPSPGEVRELFDLRQHEVASRLGIKQASISKLENRKSDAKISTLVAYIRAIGGTLEFKVHFPDFELSLDLDDEDSEVA